MPHMINSERLNLPSLRAALAERDITKVYKILVSHGVAPRTIFNFTGQAQSEVSEILSGRQVQSYEILVRIASGFGIPRGAMVLAYAEGLLPRCPPARADRG